MVTMPSRFFRFSSYWVVWSVLMGCGVVLVGTAIYFSGVAQPLRRVKIAEIVGAGKNSVLVDNQPATAGTEIATGQQVLTLPGAQVGLQQANQIVARLGAQSSVIRESDCIQLGDGRVLITNTAGCIGATIAQSKEGVFVLERLGTLGEVKVLSGEVTLTVPSNASLGTITLKANQKVTLNLTGDNIGPVRLMLPPEVTSIVASELFQGFQLAIANQNALVGLLPSASPATPTPLPSIQPSPKPIKSLAIKPPADKVPQPQPAPEPPPQTAADEPRSDHAASLAKEDLETNYSEPHANSSSAASPYSRPIRRRRYVEPAVQSNSYRRSWARSPYSSGSYRRRSPSYSAPAYSPTPDSPPAQPAPSQPVPSQPTPDFRLPPVPETSTPEIPSPVAPPVAPPISEPLPSPNMVEPPMPIPDGS